MGVKERKKPLYILEGTSANFSPKLHICLTGIESGRVHPSKSDTELRRKSNSPYLLQRRGQHFRWKKKWGSASRQKQWLQDDTNIIIITSVYLILPRVGPSAKTLRTTLRGTAVGHLASFSLFFLEQHAGLLLGNCLSYTLCMVVDMGLTPLSPLRSNPYVYHPTRLAQRLFRG